MGLDVKHALRIAWAVSSAAPATPAAEAPARAATRAAPATTSAVAAAKRAELERASVPQGGNDGSPIGVLDGAGPRCLGRRGGLLIRSEGHLRGTG